jgi:hypothetical protein
MESEEGEDRKHDDDKADEINDTVHGAKLAIANQSLGRVKSLGTSHAP